jgi:DNA-directed RNA polymerase subunit L
LKLNIVKEEEDYIELEFGGEGHTLLNLLQTSLLEDPDVDMAGYTKPHPLMDRSRLFVRLKKKGDTLKIIKRASENAEAKLKEFNEAFDEGLSKFKK